MNYFKINFGFHSSLLKRILLIALFSSLLLAGCSSFRTYEVSKRFDKERYRRVGLLVTRMGNEMWSGVSAITLQTDYSRRVPKAQSSTGFTPDSVDVYIDDDTRIRESIPSYPKFKSRSLDNVGSLRQQSEEYFRNITPELYTGIAGVFREKSYEVVNVRKLAESWEKPLSEMTIEQILTHMSGKADVLAVFHYTDLANMSLSAGTINTRTKGFSAISYTLSLFDVASKEEVVFFKPRGVYNIQVVLAHDPKILADPRYKGRLSTKEASMNGTSSLSVSHQLTDSEIVDIAVGYICHGVTWTVGNSSIENKWRGLDTVIP